MLNQLKPVLLQIQFHYLMTFSKIKTLNLCPQFTKQLIQTVPKYLKVLQSHNPACHQYHHHMTAGKNKEKNMNANMESIEKEKKDKEVTIRENMMDKKKNMIDMMKKKMMKKYKT